MGLLTDILKEIPQAAVLKEKIAGIEAKYAAAETENAILKDDLREAKAEIAKLKKQVEELTHTDDLNDAEIMILESISQHQDVNIISVAKNFEIDRGRVEYHIQRLIELKYVDFKGFAFDGIYLIQQKGREALMDRGLI